MNIYYRFRIWLADLLGSPVNVHWFGAKGDGKKDDSEAFQRAINHRSSRTQKP